MAQPSDNLDFPPVYMRLRDRALALLPFGLLAMFSQSAIDVAARTFDFKREPIQIVGDVAYILVTLPMAFYLTRMGILKLRAIYAKSPLCPLCAAKMIASDAATPSTPSDPASTFACSRCSHAATRAELRAAWRDVT